MFLISGTSFANNGLWDIFNQKNYRQNADYHKHKHKMIKLSKKAYKKICNKKNNYMFSFGIRPYTKTKKTKIKLKKNGIRK